MTDTKIIAFSAELQRDSEWTFDIDSNGERVLTCVETGQILKFPAGTTAEDIKAGLEEHRKQNMGQITQATIDKEKDEILAGLEDLKAPEEDAPMKAPSTE